MADIRRYQIQEPPKPLKNNLFNRLFRWKRMEKTFIYKHIEQWMKYDWDSSKFHNEMKRVQLSDKIPACYIRHPSYCDEFKHVNTHSIMGAHAVMYLHVLTMAKEKPEMTLKEYLEL